jgi:hypothetical protein
MIIHMADRLNPTTTFTEINPENVELQLDIILGHQMQKSSGYTRIEEQQKYTLTVQGSNK